MRTIWFVAGAGAGVYLTVRARRAAESLTPEGLQDRLAALGLGAQLFGDEVRLGMAEKESQLRERLGLGLDGPPALAAATSGGGGFETLAGARSTTGGRGARSTTGDTQDTDNTERDLT